MIKVNRRSHIKGATPEQLFATLSDPQMIGQLLPRVQKVEMLSRDDDARIARMATYMSMGGIFGTIRCEGELTWVDNREIVFTVQNPMPLETRWVLSSAVDGSELLASMSIDLAPILGPMAAFVPTQNVSDMLIKELDAAVNALARNTALRMRERARAA